MFVPIKTAVEELQISERFLRQLIHEGRIPFYRLSARTIRLDLLELRNYMQLLAEGNTENHKEEPRK